MKPLQVLTILMLCLSFPEMIDDVGGDFHGLASSWTMIPSRSLAGLHYIFKGFKIDEDEDLVQVTGPVIEIINGEKLGAKVHREGYTSEIDGDDFEEEQMLGKSVFEAVTGSGTSVGTAFLVGANMILTNRHVLSLSQDAREWSCGKFSVRLNHRDERVSCKKVRYCGRRHDYCVVELQSMSNGQSVGSEVRPLRLSDKVKNDKDRSLLHIGNAGGLGIQASRGRGIRIEGGEFYHYIPTLSGSSGAPIFNERGEVIGLNWGHSGDYVDDSSFNRGVLSKTIFEELKRTHLYTLKEIKSFRSWYRRGMSHRNVRLQSR